MRDSSGSAPPQGKHSKGQRLGEPERNYKDEGKTGDMRRCQGCNRVAHDRDTCRMTNHPDFVKTGLWADSATELAIRLWERWYGRLHMVLPDHQPLSELI